MVAVMKIGGVPTQADFHDAIATRSHRWYSACLKITRNPDMAADAVQDALLNAWNKREQFHRSARLDTWIHRIAINAALNLVRASSNRSRPTSRATTRDPIAPGKNTRSRVSLPARSDD